MTTWIRQSSRSVWGVGAGLVIALVFAYPSIGRAAEEDVVIRDQAFHGVMIDQSIPDGTVVEAGETVDVTFRFRNKGTATWVASGPRYISAYTVEPRYRASTFENGSWPSHRQAAVLNGETKPGAIGEITISFTAPDTPGIYRESFHLAAENHSWVKQANFYIELQVVPKQVTAVIEEASSVYKANRFIQSVQEVTAVGGEEIPLVLGFQNVGEDVWQDFRLVTGPDLSLASGDSISYADASWQTRSIVFSSAQPVEPNRFLRQTITFRAPTRQGRYRAEFIPQVDGTLLEDAKATVDITVTADAPAHYRGPALQGDETPVLSTHLDAEPMIRVGLWRPETFVQFRSYDDNYLIYDGERLVGTLPRTQFAVLKYANGIYTFTGGGLTIESDEYLRLVPETNPRAIFALPNYQRYVSWKGPANFNRYRGSLEFRMGEVKEENWVINELLLEDYVMGIAENTNLSPMEYLKAQSVAQRTYAYYTKLSDKYGIFDVVATTGDQLYLGVNSEDIMPRFVEAAKATRAMMATYEGEVVVTPYFARTDGRTRSWTEVWGGPQKPWLVSVKTEYDRSKGRSLLGHGVGMSQIDASLRAEREGLSWQDLVKYYYRGVEIERIYP